MIRLMSAPSVLSRRELHRGRVFTIGVERVRLPNGAETDLEIIRHPGASAIVPLTAQGEILMIRRTDNGNWAIPGGGMDLGETITDSAVRETREETGITCEITGLVGIYSNPRHVILYTSNGEVRQEFSIVFTARPTGGQAAGKTRHRRPS